MAAFGLVREREVLFDADRAGLQDLAIECFSMHPAFLFEINLLDGFVVTLSQELHRVNWPLVALNDNRATTDIRSKLIVAGVTTTGDQVGVDRRVAFLAGLDRSKAHVWLGSHGHVTLRSFQACKVEGLARMDWRISCVADTILGERSIRKHNLGSLLHDRLCLLLSDPIYQISAPIRKTWCVIRALRNLCVIDVLLSAIVRLRDPPASLHRVHTRKFNDSGHQPIAMIWSKHNDPHVLGYFPSTD